MVLYSFDSYGCYSLDSKLKDKGLDIRSIVPPVRRQSDNPFCYAYSLMDAHLRQQQIEQKSVAIGALHTRYFEEKKATMMFVQQQLQPMSICLCRPMISSRRCRK